MPCVDPSKCQAAVFICGKRKMATRHLGIRYCSNRSNDQAMTSAVSLHACLGKVDWEYIQFCCYRRWRIQQRSLGSLHQGFLTCKKGAVGTGLLLDMSKINDKKAQAYPHNPRVCLRQSYAKSLDHLSQTFRPFSAHAVLPRVCAVV
jgi:hypothetical protein